MQKGTCTIKDSRKNEVSRDSSAKKSTQRRIVGKITDKVNPTPYTLGEQGDKNFLITHQRKSLLSSLQSSLFPHTASGKGMSMKTQGGSGHRSLHMHVSSVLQ